MMYDIDRPKFIFVSLLEDFIRETEHSLAYFFALLVFLLTFLLTLFGREAFYTGLIGVFCLLLIKLRDIIEGFRETRKSMLFSFSKNKADSDVKESYQSLKELQEFYTAFDDAALTVMAKEFPKKFNGKEIPSVIEKPGLLSYLQTCWKIIETISVFFPNRPFQPETREAVSKMTAAAQKYLLHYLKRKYPLTQENVRLIEKACLEQNTDSFLLQTQLETAGIDEKTAHGIVKITELLKKIKNYMQTADTPNWKTPTPDSPTSSPVEPLSDQTSN